MPELPPRPSPPVRQESSKPTFRRFLTRAETATLVGMLLVIFSLYLPWERVPIRENIPGLPLYIAEMTRHGVNTSARWPLTLCAIVPGGLLLWNQDEKTRLTLAVVQGVCGLTCLVIALSHLSVLSGLLCTLVGGGLLTFGAMDRFRGSGKPSRPA